MLNHLTIVKDEIEARKLESEGTISRSRVFDLLASEAAMTHFDLTADEIERGVTDGGGDGGIDAAYAFLNQELITEDHEVLKPDFSATSTFRGASISLWLIQAKEESSFKSGTLITMADGLKDLLDFQKSRETLESEGYSSRVLDRIFEFREVTVALRRVHPSLSVDLAYVSVGDTAKIAEMVRVKEASLKNQLRSDLNLGQDPTIRFLGAREVWKSLSYVPNYGSELRTVDSFAHETEDGSRSYVCLVSLKDYLNFIVDTETGAYRDYLFEGNVRHHEGSTAKVNLEISESLSEETAPEFWWLNNGVTVVCSTASSQGKTFALDDVQIVNGLQTSRTIFETLSDAEEDHPAWSRNVLVRVIESQDSTTINKVIRATNRQTPVRDESLRATDEVQLLIDQHLYAKEIYYDRRRNYYKNTGKPRAKIVSIRALTQFMLAIALGKPDDARARPGDYLSNDSQYEQIFDLGFDLQIYPWVIKAQRLVDSFLSDVQDMTTSEKNDSRFIIAADIVRQVLDYAPSDPSQILTLGSEADVFTRDRVLKSLGELRTAFNIEMAKTGSARDRLAKAKSFSASFLGRTRTQ